MTIDPNDLILISIDDHVIEPADMFERHVPKRYLDQAPRVVEDEKLKQQYFWYGNQRGRSLGTNAVAGRPRKDYDGDAYRYDEMRPGCYDVHARVQDMNIGGTLAGLNFPNFTGFAGQLLNEGPDPVVNNVMIQAYNNWMLDDWCGTYPDRFIPCGLVPYCDPGLVAAEVKRLAARGCHAVTFSERPDTLGAPSIYTDHWDPFFGACADSETILCLHLGSSALKSEPPADRPWIMKRAITPMRSMTTFIDIIWAPFWFKFPSLRVSITEGDIGWMPYFVQQADYVLKSDGHSRPHHFPPGVLVSDLVRERLLCCFIDDPVGIELLHHFNIDNVFWEQDYPHSDGKWPFGPEVVAEIMADLSPEVVEKVTHTNAMRHYHFDPFVHRTKEEATAGALRATAVEGEEIRSALEETLLIKT